LSYDYSITSKLDKLGKAKINQLLIIDLLNSVNTDGKFNKEIMDLKSCSENIVIKKNSNNDSTKLSKAFFCKNHMLCRICAEGRRFRNLNKYKNKFNALIEENKDLKISLITTTIKDNKNLVEGLAEIKYIHKLISCKIKDFKRGKNSSEWGKIDAYITSFEVSRSNINKDYWHPHAHMLTIHNENFNYEKLHQEWSKITNDEKYSNIDVKKIPIKDFEKTLRYITKPISEYLDIEDNILFYKTLKKEHFIRSGGKFRGLKIESNKEDDLTIYDKESVYSFGLDFKKYYHKSEKIIINKS
jgi:hypothetical protein